MSAHTPGPWTISAHTAASPEEITPGCDWTVNGPTGESVCFEGSINECASGNARLIAAAPDLLAALVPVVKDAEQAEFEIWFANELPSGDMDSVHRQWQASSEYRSFCEHWQSQITAIAKARGTP